MANKKDFQELRRLAEKQGWEVSPGGGGHLHWRSPVCKHKVISSNTPRDPRALKNHLGYMKKHGWGDGQAEGVCTA